MYQSERPIARFFKRGLLPLIGKVIVFLLIFAFAVFICILAYRKPPPYYSSYSISFDFHFNPRDSLSPFNTAFENYTVLLDQHSHSVYSDGSLSVEKNLQWHLAYGYNAVIVSDHNNLDGAKAAQKVARQKYKDKLVVIPAMEWTTCRLHMNLIGISEVIPTFSAYPSDDQIRYVINETHRQGGIVVVNHIPWTLDSGLGPEPSREQLFEWGADYIEAIHRDNFDLTSVQFCEQTGMGVISGTDLHEPGPPHGWTTLMPANFSEEAVFEELKARRTSFLFTPQSVPYNPTVKSKVNPGYFLAYPFILLGWMFSSFYSYNPGTWSYNSGYCHNGSGTSVSYRDAGVCVAWAVFIFVFLEISKVAVRRFKEKYGKRIRKSCLARCCPCFRRLLRLCCITEKERYEEEIGLLSVDIDEDPTELELGSLADPSKVQQIWM